MAKKSEVIEEVVQEEQVFQPIETVVDPTLGHTTRAYRSFAVPMGSAVAESLTPATDGGQEEA
jgi:hypothetical protein